MRCEGVIRYPSNNEVFESVCLLKLRYGGRLIIKGIPISR